MKNKLILFIMLLVTVFISSCEINDPTVVPNDFKYVAFTKNSMNLFEHQGTINIEVGMLSHSNESVECTFTISTEKINNPAVEGVDYYIGANRTITFEKGTGYASIPLELINNPLVVDPDGTRELYLIISSAPSDFQIGFEGVGDTLRIGISDKHPLEDFSGSYNHVGTCVWNGASTWTTQLRPDPNNSNQVIISGIFYWWTSVALDIYAVIDQEAKTFTIPTGQKAIDRGSLNYFKIMELATVTADWKAIETNNDIVGTYTINDDKTNIVITLNNWGCPWFFGNTGERNDLWCEAFITGSTMTKKP